MNNNIISSSRSEVGIKVKNCEYKCSDTAEMMLLIIKIWIIFSR